MSKSKSGSGIVIHAIITVVGIAAAFMVGWKMAGAGKGDLDKQLAELKSSIEANDTAVKSANSLAEANSRGLASADRKIALLSGNVSRGLSAAEAKIAGSVSTGKGMSYMNDVMGLTFHTRYPTGHRYCLTPYPLPWKHAQEFAKKIGGTLVVIDDEEENTWVVEKFGSDTEYWIGLTDEVDEGKWLWVNDLDLLYKNWANGEPDNYKKMQHHVIMNKQAAKGTIEAGKWNDVDGNTPRIGIIEVNR